MPDKAKEYVVYHVFYDSSGKELGDMIYGPYITEREARETMQRLIDETIVYLPANGRSGIIAGRNLIRDDNSWELRVENAAGELVPRTTYSVGESLTFEPLGGGMLGLPKE